MQSSASQPRAFTAATAFAACLAFALIGSLASAYGPLLPTFVARYGLTPAQAAFPISANAAGAFVGVLVAAQLLRSGSHRRFLAAALLTLATGCLVFAFAPAWSIVLVGALLIGVGFGMLDLGLNTLFAHGFGARSGAMLNLINGAYGVGAIAGPLLVAATAAAVTPLYLAAALVGGGLVVPLLRVSGRESADAGERDPLDGAIVGGALRMVGLFALAYFLYVGVEVSVAGWEPTHLASIGLTAQEAAAATSGLWLSITLGRFLIAPIALRVSARRIVLACSATVVVTLALASVPGLAPYAYAATGLAMGPIFPSGIAWLAHAAAPRRPPTTYLFAASMLGGLAFPPLIGVVIERSGVATAPIVLAGVAAGSAGVFGCVALVLRTRRSAGRHDHYIGE